MKEHCVMLLASSIWNFAEGGRKRMLRTAQQLFLLYLETCGKTGGVFSKRSSRRAENVVELGGHQKLLNFLARVLYVRNFVSKRRRRMLIAGYDLDMSYITNCLLAMSFPAQSMRAMYRNPLWQVKCVLEMRHSGHYKVYNLCAEESYDASHFHGRVEIFPFDDNHVPTLSMIKLFCESVHAWLSADPQNVAVVHCMAGKGRTGLMVCSYLVYNGMTAEEALQIYADRRTTDNKGVSIASQQRYLGYWSKILTFSKEAACPIVNLPKLSSRELRRIRLYDTVNISCVFFVVSELQEVPGQAYHPPVEMARSCCRYVKQDYRRANSPRYYLSFIDIDEDEEKSQTRRPHFVVQMDTESSVIDKKMCLDCYFEKPLLVSGDVRVSFYEKMIGGRLFYMCFNTSFIKNSLLQLPLSDLDKVGYKSKFICGSDFFVELLFGPAPVEHM